MMGNFLEWLGRKIGAQSARRSSAQGLRPLENDQALEEKLEQHIQECLDRTGHMPVVSLEDFFQGNHDLGSIGCNLLKHPGINEFAARLFALRALPEVQDVLVGITDFEPETEGIWPFSEIIYVLTSLSAADVAGRLKALEPDEVYEDGAPDRMPPYHNDLPEPLPGFKLLIAWWD